MVWMVKLGNMFMFHFPMQIFRFTLIMRTRSEQIKLTIKNLESIFSRLIKGYLHLQLHLLKIFEK